MAENVNYADNEFRGGLEPKDSDVFIAVMGVTGAGKSTFISKCTAMNVQIGHDLQACTQDVEVYHCPCFSAVGINVYLVDTPGFDDTSRSDKEVLKEIATWLGSSYKKKIRLNGIIYLHRITDTRMQGSALKNLLMFKKLCGPEALQHVILATTMWERLHDEGLGQKREVELIERDDFWGWMMRQGSQVRRHYNTWESAMELLKIYVSSAEKPIPLQIQMEIVDQKITLDETGAGQELDSALSKEREKMKQELADIAEMQAEMEAEMREALAVRDEQTALMLEESRRELTEKLVELERDREGLKVSFESMYEERIAKLEKELRASHEANKQLQRVVNDIAAKRESRQPSHQTSHSFHRRSHDNRRYADESDRWSMEARNGTKV
ncbi:putative zinc finger C2H2 [Rosellinia necatrix]|uniref:Putative zinc finger C2H2 n=1 Tax=Rosellinia necatrix TaxID=77044 RepID=A0A1S7UMW4_ROSNE|nr:putative zinc finger C2H2 [Rosellinia necatrix]